jgi:bifunctional non-homologous end joining protein LigD
MAKSTNNKPRGDPTGLPSWVKPQLCKLVDAPPQGPEWLHEIKYDSYRMHARVDRGRVSLLTRTGLDWTHKYPAISVAMSALPAGSLGNSPQRCSARAWIDPYALGAIRVVPLGVTPQPGAATGSEAD